MKRCSRGFTLLEMLLVLIVISTLILMLVNYIQQRTIALQIAKTSTQMQIILNAGLAYYRNNEQWPQDIQTLQTEHYLPDPLLSPWGQPYLVSANSDIGVFSVNTAIPETKIGIAIAGRVPLGTFTSGTVTGLTTLPTEELNSARAVRFVSVYHSGACVPAPECPLKMKPQIFILPASAYGINPYYSQNPSCSDITNPATCTFQLTPIHKVSVWANGDGHGNPKDLKTGDLPACDSTLTAPEFVRCARDMTNNSYGDPVYSGEIQEGKYWRVCLNTTTKFGSFTTNWGGASGRKDGLYGSALGSVLVFTKCVPVNEATGSSYQVWGY